MGSGFDLARFSIKPAAMRPFVFHQILDAEGNPATLIVKHAGESNATFLSAAFKQAKIRDEAGAGQKSLTPARLKETRLEAAALYSRFVVADWKHMPLEVGAASPTPFSSDACLRFLEAVIEHLPEAFDALRNFCGNADNFRDPVVDPVDLGKG